MLDALHAGLSVASIAHDLQISDQTIYAWRRQDRIESGETPGLTTAQNTELRAAKKRIAELELQLAVATKAVEVLKADTSPKGDTRRWS
ncbi:transposase [Nesterenkonia sp. YGD6]|nr:transposase [Nesterenkonia sp. YGD6]